MTGETRTSESGWTVDTLKAHLDEAITALRAAGAEAANAAELRYQQRFEAQSDALSAAFLAQQKAMETAFTVAEKAVQAALAAADRAVSKAELAADKRFEALNELRQMLNDMVATLFPRIEAEGRFKAMAEKIEAAEKRLDSMLGAQQGAGRATDMVRSNLAALVGIVVLLVLLWRAFTGR